MQRGHNNGRSLVWWSVCDRVGVASKIANLGYTLVLGTWYLVPGTWYLVGYGWYLVLDTWYPIPGTWYLMGYGGLF